MGNGLNFLHNHYTLGVKLVLTCYMYYFEEACKVKDKVIDYDNCVAIVAFTDMPPIF